MKQSILSLLACCCLLSACSRTENIEETASPQATDSTPVISIVDLPVEVMAPLDQPDFETNWHLATTDSNAEMNNTATQMNITLHYPGTQADSVQVFHDGIPMTSGAVYHLSFEITSSIQRPVEVSVINLDDGSVQLSQTITASSQATHCDLEITVSGATSWNGRIVFNLGPVHGQGQDEYHEITLANVQYRLSEDQSETPNIKVNQVGYLPQAQKKVVFPYDQGDYFQVIQADSGEVVYTAPIIGRHDNESTGETTYYGDFSALTTPGRYRIQAQIAGTSYEFKIREDLYHSVLDSAVKMLNLQRCGQTLSEQTAGALAHEECHNSLALVYGTEEMIDVSGGWHDAGDYGRYVVTGVKTVTDLMLAWQLNPDLFTDDLGIAESGNGVADILDEARWELQWLLSMQNSWGGVYDKVVTASFPGYISPDQDDAPLFVMQEMSTATGGTAAALALASVIYQSVDPQFSQQCLNAAEKSWDYLQQMTLTPYSNPEGFSTGHYTDTVDADERYFASAALYYATGQTQYLDQARSLFEADASLLHGVEWKNTGTYGTWLLLKSETLMQEDPDFAAQLLTQLIGEAESILSATTSDSYFVSLYNNYVWGSNSLIANNGLILALANDLRPNINYVNSSADHLHYLLGRNSLNLSFVTATGSQSPHNLHHRPALAVQTTLPGALVGGPNASLEDPITQSLFSDQTPPARCYIDNTESYSTNEVAIYWNSPLIALISVVEKNN